MSDPKKDNESADVLAPAVRSIHDHVNRAHEQTRHHIMSLDAKVDGFIRPAVHSPVTILYVIAASLAVFAVGYFFGSI